MERTDILELMSRLKLFGMRAAYDEVMANGIKRHHESPRIVGDLLSAEIAEKHARSIKYQLTIAKLPPAKDLDGFDCRFRRLRTAIPIEPGADSDPTRTGIPMIPAGVVVDVAYGVSWPRRRQA